MTTPAVSVTGRSRLEWHREILKEYLRTYTQGATDGWGVVRPSMVDPLVCAIKAAHQEFPDVVPDIDPVHFIEEHRNGVPFYHVISLRTHLAATVAAINRELGPQQRRVVFTLHGIQTHAGWQRQFSDVAQELGWTCRLGRWNFGFFSALKLILPYARTRKILWMNQTYESEMTDTSLGLAANERPSVIAHSFGTYILGYALLKYSGIRFNKVILCGSILPEDFPWDLLVQRDQIQAVRNEFGSMDRWTRLAKYFVKGTGPSGSRGFRTTHEVVEQERFTFAHSEYFDRRHMREKWFSFLETPAPLIVATTSVVSDNFRQRKPWGLYIGISVLLLALGATGWSIRPARPTVAVPKTETTAVPPAVPHGQQADTVAGAAEQIKAMFETSQRLSYSERDSALRHVISFGLSHNVPELVIGYVERLGSSSERDGAYRDIIGYYAETGQFVLAEKLIDKLSYSSDRDAERARLLRTVK